MALKKQNKALVKATLLSPLSIIVVVALSGAIQDLTIRSVHVDWTLKGYFGGILILSAYAVPIAYIGVLFIGLPLHFILCRLNQDSLRNYLTGGAVAGLVIAITMGGIDFPWMLTLITVSSIAVSSSFWYFIKEAERGE